MALESLISWEFPFDLCCFHSNSKCRSVLSRLYSISNFCSFLSCFNRNLNRVVFLAFRSFSLWFSRNIDHLCDIFFIILRRGLLYYKITVHGYANVSPSSIAVASTPVPQTATQRSSFPRFLSSEVVTRSLHLPHPLPSSITLIFSLHPLLFETLKTAILAGGRMN